MSMPARLDVLPERNSPMPPRLGGLRSNPDLVDARDVVGARLNPADPPCGVADASGLVATQLASASIRRTAPPAPPVGLGLQPRGPCWPGSPAVPPGIV